MLDIGVGAISLTQRDVFEKGEARDQVAELVRNRHARADNASIPRRRPS